MLFLDMLKRMAIYTYCADAFGSCRAAKGSQAEAAQRTLLGKGAGACLSKSA